MPELEYKYRLHFDQLTLDGNHYLDGVFTLTSSRSMLLNSLKEGIYYKTFFIPWHSITSVEFLGKGWTK